MQAGDLDERVTFKRLTSTPDGEGGSTESWASVATVYAKVKPITGDESQQTMRTEATRRYLVTIRYRSDFREEDRIEWRDRKMNIRVIRDMGPRATWLEIEADLGVTS